MKQLEAEVCECAVSFCHFVHILFALELAALLIVGIYDFSSEFVGHSLAATRAGIEDEVFH